MNKNSQYSLWLPLVDSSGNTCENNFIWIFSFNIFIIFRLQISETVDSDPVDTEVLLYTKSCDKLRKVYVMGLQNVPQFPHVRPYSFPYVFMKICSFHSIHSLLALWRNHFPFHNFPVCITYLIYICSSSTQSRLTDS